VNTVLVAAFWWSVATVAYIYAGYPLLVGILCRLRPRSVSKASVNCSVSVVLAAHNEARRIVPRLNNLLSLHGAEAIREILVGSDGSTDETPALVQTCTDPRVRLIAFPVRRGKAAVLNDLISRCTGDVVLLTDARQEFAPDCLQALLANFADPTVGVVSGELVLRTTTTTTTAAAGIGSYWRYEKWIRRCESRFRGVPGATGACYALRRAFFRPIDENTLLDDVAIPMHIVCQGFRCVFEPAAIAWDDPARTPTQEAIRKRRTIAGAVQLLRLYPQWLNPRCNPLWWEYVSHKVARLTSPGWLMLALASNAALAAYPLYRVLFVAQLAFYAAAVCGWCYQQLGRRSQLFGPFLMFLILNLTTIRALWDALRSRYDVTWKKALT
jgi:cellulose synthase/poly-beta-1,6-N-acetylglucosamine synthase-like glycosyltransferase